MYVEFFSLFNSNFHGWTVVSALPYIHLDWKEYIRYSSEEYSIHVRLFMCS